MGQTLDEVERAGIRGIVIGGVSILLVWALFHFGLHDESWSYIACVVMWLPIIVLPARVMWRQKKRVDDAIQQIMDGLADQREGSGFSGREDQAANG
jgi:hypothetical protein